MKKRLFFTLCFVCIAATGLLPGQQPPTTDQADKIIEEDLPKPINPALASARATMRTFLEAFSKKDDKGEYYLDETEAIVCLDLSHLNPDVQALKGKELVIQLKEVIDRTEFVDVEKISDANEGSPYVFLRQPSLGEVTIERQPNGDWLFTKHTVRSLPDLRRALEEKKVVEGVEVEAPKDASFSAWVRSKTPGVLHVQILFFEFWQWIGLILLVLVGILVDKIVVFLVQGSVNRYLKRRKQKVDPELLHTSLRPVGLPAMAFVWWIGISCLGLPAEILQIFIVAVKFIVTVAVVMMMYRLVDLISDLFTKRAEKTESRFDDLLVPLIRKSVKVFIVAFGVVFVADNLGTDVQGLLAGIGLGGLAVALAAKDAISNLFGSLTILLDRPFQVGDWVVIGNVEGTVEEVGFRSTRIRTFQNSLITLPNSILINASVDNLGVREFRRWSTKLTIAYNTPPEKIDAFCEGVRELIRRHPYTRKDYFHVYLNEFGAASLNIILYVFFVAPDWATELRERHRLAVDMLRLADEMGVEFAFPTQTLYMRREEWSVPTTAEGKYPQETIRQQEEAQKMARQLADGVLDGKTPPPVTISAPSELDHGDAG